MSSSKIIKSDRIQELRISTVSYGGLSSDAVAAESVLAPASTFMPMHLGEYAAPAEPSVELSAVAAPSGEQVVLEPGMMMIAEEELSSRVDAAFRKGIDEGRQQTERGLANVFRSLREGIDDISRLREKVLRDSEEDLLKLAIMVARKIVQQEISQDEHILAKIVAETISCCSDLDRITIRLNPEDCTRVSDNRHFYLSGIGANTHVSLIPDDTILPGGCMVDTVTGTIDARIDVQLDEIYRRFLETRGAHDVDAVPRPEEVTS